LVYTHYEQETFTDKYSEYFEDDENKADRFTDDYRRFQRLVEIGEYRDYHDMEKTATNIYL
jgi:hypothetical protein